MSVDATPVTPPSVIMMVDDEQMAVFNFLMPSMNGIEFMSVGKRMGENIPRVLLTGYADKENAIRRINEVDLCQYVEKHY